jgi:4'-phosphopantetheinyl transferase
VEASETWRCPAGWPSLSSGEVHVWRIPLDLPEVRVQALVSLLSSSEREEAERRAGDRSRRRFVVARGALRTILAGYEGREPDLLRLHTQQGGKPYLASGAAASSLSFNLSHSHELALCAVALDRAVGVDLEWIRPVAAMEEIAVRYFSEQEAAQWHALPCEQALQGFLTIWTRKEACGKALGEGVSRLWARFGVSPDTGVEANTLDVERRNGERIRLRVWGLNVGPDYLAAVAAEGDGWGIRHWQWG